MTRRLLHPTLPVQQLARRFNDLNNLQVDTLTYLAHLSENLFWALGSEGVKECDARLEGFRLRRAAIFTPPQPVRKRKVG
jgi:hypothetical protein